MINLIGNISDRIITRDGGDAARIITHETSVDNVNIIDINPDDEAHNDGFQLFAPSRKGLSNQQYAGAKLCNVSIRNSSVYSAKQLQGGFGSDGLFEGIEFINFMADTQSQHKCTFNGVLDGVFEKITDGKGNKAPVILNPLRLCGGLNIWVLSFKGGMKYQPIKHSQGSLIQDNRESKQPGINLFGFDYDLFRYAVESMPYPTGKNSTQIYVKQLKELALQFGEVA